tara:strand:+ start:1035 stop:1235 length:201 start_codon:yes stop_codon:yes gene_type:complete
MANTENEQRYIKNVKNSDLLIISVVFVINVIKIIDNEKNIIEITILKKSERYEKCAIEDALSKAVK